MITLTAKDLLPEDGTSGTLVGRVWLPQLAARPWSRSAATACSTSARVFRPSARCARRPIRPPRCAASRRSGSAISKARRQHAARPARPAKTLAARAARSAGAEGRRRHLCDLDAGTRDRGAGARQSGVGGSHPKGGGAAGRRRFLKAQARLAGGDEAEAGADRAERLEPVSGSRHRPRRGSVHQGADAVLGRHRHGCRAASEIDLEQSRAGSRAGGVEPRRRSSARCSATTSICATSRGARRCCCRRPRTTTPPAPSARCCGCSTRAFRSTTCARWTSA